MADSVVPIQPRLLIDTAVSQTSRMGDVPLNDAEPVEVVRQMMQSFSTEELLLLLSPERKALFDRLRSLRMAIGPILSDTTAEIRELREDD